MESCSAGLFDSLAGADHVGRCRALYPLEVRVGAQQLLHALVRPLGVVGGLDAVTDERHVRVVLLLMLLRGVDPLHMGGGGERADHLGVLTLFTHRLGELVHQVDPVLIVLERLDVVVGVLDRGRFMSDHDDVGIHGLGENLFDGIGLEGRDAEGRDAGGDEVFDHADLRGGVRLGGSLVVGILACVLGVELDAFFHAVEPRYAGELREP